MRSSDYFSCDFKKIFEEQLLEFKSEDAKVHYASKVSELCDFAKKDFLELSKSDVVNYFDAVKRRSNNSKSLWLSIFRSVAKNVDAVRDTNLAENFIISADIHPDVYVDPEKLPPLGEIDKLLSYLKDSNDEQLFLILSLMLETGISINELISLKVGNIAVDTSGRVYLVFLPTVEEGITRYIPISKKTALLLDKQGSKGETFNKDSNIFLNKYHEPISLRSVQMSLKKACEDAKTKPIRLNDVKTIARAAMLKGGASMDSLSYQTGLTKTWFFRLNRLVKEYNTAAASFNILKVDSDV